MKTLIISLALGMSAIAAMAADMSRGADNFYRSDKVTAAEGYL